MTDFKNAFGSPGTFTITNANIASSATAGWMGNTFDNSSSLFQDLEITVELAAVNTAPANNQAIYMFVSPSLQDSSGAFTGTGSASITGTEGTVTYPDITSKVILVPLLGVIPYPTQNVAIVSPTFSVVRALGFMPTRIVPGMLNYSGMTLSVTAIRYRGIYQTGL